MKLVTILDEGRIPWTNIVGPVFGYPMTDGQYSFLTKTNVLIKLTTPEQAKKDKAAYYAKKVTPEMQRAALNDEHEENVERVLTHDSVEFVRKPAKEAENIRNDIAENNGNNDERYTPSESIKIVTVNKDNMAKISVPLVDVVDKKIKEQPSEEKPKRGRKRIHKAKTPNPYPFRRYSFPVLHTKSYDELMEILVNERNITEGPYAPKDGDDTRALMLKVWNSQLTSHKKN